MLVIDENNLPYKEGEALREKMSADPLVLHRRGIEAAFLDDLTRLTRKYGLAIKADTQTEYGETYPDHRLETASYGTAGRYQIGTFGIEWEAAHDGKDLPCAVEERAQFETSRAERKAEGIVINGYSRDLRRLHFEMMQVAHEAGMKRLIESQPKTKPTFSCSCSSVIPNRGRADSSHDDYRSRKILNTNPPI